MDDTKPWFQEIVMPALSRHARATYGRAMRRALAEAGYDDIPRNGLYVIGGLALGAGGVPLGQLVAELGVSKQGAGQLVDTLVLRGYLERTPDADDRRKLTVSLTERGRADPSRRPGKNRRRPARTRWPGKHQPHAQDARRADRNWKRISRAIGRTL